MEVKDKQLVYIPSGRGFLLQYTSLTPYLYFGDIEFDGDKRYIKDKGQGWKIPHGLN